jgi:hypothetical protein
LPERLYSESHYQAFLDRLSENHIAVLSVIAENSHIQKNDIIAKLKGQLSKVPVIGAIQALEFSGLIKYKYSKRRHLYYLSEDGLAFSDYAQQKMQEA